MLRVRGPHLRPARPERRQVGIRRRRHPNRRTRDQRRRLSLAYIDEAARTFGVAREAVYVMLTEHDGEHFQLSVRVLPSWSPGEDPLGDL
jgi:hypothetical protein